MFEETLGNSIRNSLPMIIIIFVVLFVVRIGMFRNGKAKFILHEEVMNLLFIFYVLLLFELLTGAENNYGNGINLVPFHEITRYEVGSSMFIYNVLGNILLFIPFGFFLSRDIKAKNLFQPLIASVIVSLTVEMVQYSLVERSFDIDDIILNTVGGIIGYLLFIGFDAIRTHLPKFLQKNFIYDVLCIIILALFVIYILNICGIRWY